MSWVLVVSCSLGVSPSGSIPSDELDAYAKGALKARRSCGATAAWYCLRRLGHDVQLDEVWQQARISENGTSLEDLLGLLHSHGLPAQALVGNRSRLDDLPVPAILVVRNRRHCVVYEGADAGGQGVRYFEPSDGRLRTASREDMQRYWSGEVIVFEAPALPPLLFGLVALLGAAGMLGLVAAGNWIAARGGLLTRPSPPQPSPVAATAQFIVEPSAQGADARPGGGESPGD